jgi:hypothetical protein
VTLSGEQQRTQFSMDTHAPSIRVQKHDSRLTPERVCGARLTYDSYIGHLLVVHYAPPSHGETSKQRAVAGRRATMGTLEYSRSHSQAVPKIRCSSLNARLYRAVSMVAIASGSAQNRTERMPGHTLCRKRTISR